MKRINISIILISLFYFSACSSDENVDIELEVDNVEEQEEERPQLTEEEIEELCKSFTEEKRSVLDVQTELETLQKDLEEREAELERLRSDIQNNKIESEEKRAAAKRRWNKLQEEVATLQVKLASVEKERDELRVELKDTIKKLDYQISETKKYKSKAKKYKKQSTKNLWQAFRAEARNQGCNRGSKKRHEKCWEAFDVSMSDALKQRFTTCVNTYQAVPILKKAPRGESLPSFSEWLPKENKYTKGWYVIFCDPSLPEKGDPDLDESSTPLRKKQAPVDDELNLDNFILE
jgi:chromosome segregation ATPase